MKTKKILSFIQSHTRLLVFIFLVGVVPLTVYVANQVHDVRQHAAVGPIDTLNYFLTKHPNIRLVGNGNPYSQVIDMAGKRAYYMKDNNNDYEMFTWDDNYIYLKEDHSTSTADPTHLSDGRWMKRYMSVGETIDAPNNTLSHYHTNSCGRYGDQPWSYKVTLESQSRINLGGEIGWQDVIVLRYDWLGHYEKFTYTSEYGWVSWEAGLQGDYPTSNNTANTFLCGPLPNPAQSCSDSVTPPSTATQPYCNVPNGVLEKIAPDGTVTGWAKDADGSAPVQVAFYIDGKEGVGRNIGVVMANQSRSDANNGYGFTYKLPSQYLSGHKLYANGLDNDGRQNGQLINSPMNTSAAAPPTPTAPAPTPTDPGGNPYYCDTRVTGTTPTSATADAVRMEPYGGVLAAGYAGGDWYWYDNTLLQPLGDGYNKGLTYTYNQFTPGKLYGIQAHIYSADKNSLNTMCRQNFVTLPLPNATHEDINTYDYFFGGAHGPWVNSNIQVREWPNKLYNVHTANNFDIYTWDNDYIYWVENHGSSAPDMSKPSNFALAPRAKWLKHYMKVGEPFAAERYIPLAYYKNYKDDNSCSPNNINNGSHYYTNFAYDMTIESHITNYDAGTLGHNLDVIVVKYDYGTDYEKYYYAKGLGQIKWERFTREDTSKTSSVSSSYPQTQTYPVCSFTPGCQSAFPSCTFQSSGAAPTSIPTPTTGTSSPTATPTLPFGAATIIIQFKDEAGNNVPVTSGKIYVNNASGSDSDEMDIAKGDIQCFKKQPTPGQFNCTKYADKWYGGIYDSNPPTGFTIVDNGISRERGETPLTLSTSGTIIINVILRPNIGGSGGGNPAYVPNCQNLQGPTTIQLGQSATYLAAFTSPEQTNFFGAINAVKTTNTTPTDSTTWEWLNYPPKSIPASSGNLSFTWKPTTAGVYQVFCQAFNGSAGECRGAANTVNQNPPYVCTGPSSVLTVNVTASAPTTGGSRQNMCQFATTIGSKVLTANTPVTLYTVAKPNFNIKSYKFAFYNLDNQYPKPWPPGMETNPKGIYFNGTPFAIDSTSNTVTVKYEDLHKPDTNNGGQIPTNIQVNAYFTDAQGIFSTPEKECVTAIKLSTIAPTDPIPSPTYTVTKTSNDTRINLIATAGVLLIAVVVSLNFFFN